MGKVLKFLRRYAVRKVPKDSRGTQIGAGAHEDDPFQHLANLRAGARIRMIHPKWRRGTEVRSLPDEIQNNNNS